MRLGRVTGAVTRSPAAAAAPASASRAVAAMAASQPAVEQQAALAPPGRTEQPRAAVEQYIHDINAIFCMQEIEY